MKRILHLRASNFVGGPERQLLRHAEAQTQTRWQIVLGTFLGPNEGRELLDRAQRGGIQTVGLRSRGLRSMIAETVQLIRGEQIDLLCSHGYKADIVGMLAARRAGVPVACFLRGWTGENWTVRAYEQLDRWSLRYADRIVCLSKSQAERFAAKPSLYSKIRVVCNATYPMSEDEESRKQARGELRSRLALPHDCKIVASAGRLSPEKGVQDFVSVIEGLSREFPHVRFAIFGDGTMRRALRSQARKAGVDERLVFAGFHSDLPRLLMGIDILVNPSYSEEMPNIVLEAMAAGVSVVATDVGGVREIAGSDPALALVPPRKPNTLADAIRELLANEDAARRIAEAGRKRAITAYSPQAQQRQFEALYEELLSSRENAPAQRKVSNQQADEVTPSERERAERRPKVSIVVPVRNEEAHIRSVLSQIESQDYPRDRVEVFVVDGNSTDGTREAVAEFAKTSSIGVRLLPNPAQLSSAGRNAGVAASSGEYIAFVDGHCWIPSRNLVRETVRLFEETGAACLCRPQPLTHPLNDGFQEVVASVRATRLGHGSDSTIYDLRYEGEVNPSSSGAIYRRSVFDTVGVYDEAFDACEDVELNFRVWKARLKSYSSPLIAVHYRPRKSVTSLWNQMVRYGRGRCRLLSKHPQAFSTTQLVPALFVIWIVAGAALSTVWPSFRWIYGGSLGVYVALIGASAVRLGWRRGWRHLVWAPVVYAVVHVGLGVGFLGEFARRIARSLGAWLGPKRQVNNTPYPHVLNKTGGSEADA